MEFFVFFFCVNFQIIGILTDKYVSSGFSVKYPTRKSFLLRRNNYVYTKNSVLLELTRKIVCIIKFGLITDIYATKCFSRDFLLKSLSVVKITLILIVFFYSEIIFIVFRSVTKKNKRQVIKSPLVIFFLIVMSFITLTITF